MDFYAIVCLVFFLVWCFVQGGMLAIGRVLKNQQAGMIACHWCASPMPHAAKLCLYCGREKPTPRFVLPENSRFKLIEPSDN